MSKSTQNEPLFGNVAMVEEFLSQKCELRYNVLSGHVEMDGKPMTSRDEKSLILAATDELDEIKGVKTIVADFLGSTRIESYNPVDEFLTFVATTNSPHPLQDVTGSRRYLCVQIPAGKIIDVETVIDYGQLYAQIIDELDNQKLRTWFNDEEVDEIQLFNSQFQSTNDLETMLEVCYRQPKAGEEQAEVTVKEIIDTIVAQFPNVAKQKLSNIKMGLILKHKGFECVHKRTGSIYNVVPLVA